MRYTIQFQENITCWEEALPLGNGEMGCLVWGSPRHLRFSLDRTDIWDCTPAPGTESREFTYQNLVRLAQERDNDSIRKIFDDPYNYPLPTKLPAGKIILALKGYDNLSSCLQLWDGQAVLDLENGITKGPQIKSVVHATKRIGMISVELPMDRVSVTLQPPEFARRLPGEAVFDSSHTERGTVKGSLQSLRYEAPVRKREVYGGKSYIEVFRQKISEEFSFGVVMGVQEKQGKTEIFYRIVTSKDTCGEDRGECPFEQAEVRIRELMALGYETLFLEHEKWWQEFWGMSAIALPDQELERSWYISNYLLASCSREGRYPMPLQGVWPADENALPPWKGDYHHDLNTQMSYYHYLKANHLPQGKSFVDFLWNLRQEGRAFAKRFYGTGGLCLPSVMSIDGKPLGGWPMYTLAPVNQIWLCRAFDDYYRYSGEQEFLAERAYPYFRETAECISALLKTGEDGFLRFPISSSPEIHDDELEAFVTPNSNYDLAFLHYLYDTLTRYAEVLAPEEKDVQRKRHLEQEAEQWRIMSGRLSPLAVDGQGILMIAADEVLTESHRHHSHAQAIHPLRLIKYDTPEHRRIIDATIHNLEELGTGMWVGFSFCWMAELYAIARQGGKAAEQLKIFWRNFCSPNGFHLNGDQKAEGYSTFTYRPFTLEANMCAADALQEMLLFGEDGIIEVFPALPEEWQRQGVSFEKLRTENGILVSAAVKDKKLTKLVLEAPRQVRVKLRGWDQKGERKEDQVYMVVLQQGENRFEY